MQTTTPNPADAATQANPHDSDIATALAKWSTASAKAREVIFDAMQLQHEIEKLVPAKPPKHLARDLPKPRLRLARDVAKRIAAIRALNLNGMLLDLAETEDDGAKFLEDNVRFISEDEDKNPPGVDGYPEAKRAQQRR